MKILRFLQILGVFLILVFCANFGAWATSCSAGQYFDGNTCQSCATSADIKHPDSVTDANNTIANCYGNCDDTSCELFEAWNTYLPDTYTVQNFAVNKSSGNHVDLYGLTTPNHQFCTFGDDTKYCTQSVYCSTTSNACKPNTRSINFKNQDGTKSLGTLYTVLDAVWSTQKMAIETDIGAQTHSGLIYPVFQSPEAPEIVGYQFTGWEGTVNGNTVTLNTDISNNTTGLTYNDAHALTANDIELHATYMPKTDDVLYLCNDDGEHSYTDIDGATGGQSYTVKSDSLVGCVAPTGYVFAGWTTTNNPDTVYYTGDSIPYDTLYAGNFNLKAKWSGIGYKVMYKCDNDSVTEIMCGASACQDSAVYGEDFTPTSIDTSTLVATCNKDGYKFAGWYISCEPETHTESSWTWGGNCTNGGTETLVATWTQNTYNVTYTCGAGNGEGNTHTNGAIENQPYTVKPLSWSGCTAKPGYEFAGWIANDDSPERLCRGGDGETNCDEAPWSELYNNNFTFTAKWNPTCNAIAFDDTTNGGTSTDGGNDGHYWKWTDDTNWYSDIKCSTIANSVSVRDAIPTKENAVFAGYYDGEHMIFDRTGALTRTGVDWTVAANPTTLVAVYECEFPYHPDPNNPNSCVACDTSGTYWDGTECKFCATDTDNAYPHSTPPFNWSIDQCFAECGTKTCNTSYNPDPLPGLTKQIIQNTSGKQVKFYGNRNEQFSSCDVESGADYCPYGILYFSCSTGNCSYIMTNDVVFNGSVDNQSRNISGFATKNNDDWVFNSANDAKFAWGYVGPAQKHTLATTEFGTFDTLGIIYPFGDAPLPTDLVRFAGYTSPSNGSTVYVDYNGTNAPLTVTNARDVAQNLNSGVVGTTNLYPKYNSSQFSCTYTYNCNDGTGTGQLSYTIAQGETHEIKPTSLCTRDGYTPSGWTSAPEVQGTTVVCGDNNIQNVTFTAGWTGNTITIDWDESQGSTISSNGSCTYGTDTFTVPAVGTTTRNGYILTGWSLNGGTTVLPGASGNACNYTNLGEYDGTSNKVVAQWYICPANTYQIENTCQPCPDGYESASGSIECSPKCLSVTFNDHGGTNGNENTTLYKLAGANNSWYRDSSCKTTPFTGALNIPNDPDTKPFNGYYTMASGGTQVFGSNAMVNNTTWNITTNTILHAQYGTKPDITVTYDCNKTGANTIPNGTAHYNDQFTPADPSLCGLTDGSVFAGWLVSGTSDYVSDTFTWTYSSAKTLTAQWCDACPDYGSGVESCTVVAQTTTTPAGTSMTGKCEYNITCQSDWIGDDSSIGNSAPANNPCGRGSEWDCPDTNLYDGYCADGCYTDDNVCKSCGNHAEYNNIWFSYSKSGFNTSINNCYVPCEAKLFGRDTTCNGNVQLAHDSAFYVYLFPNQTGVPTPSGDDLLQINFYGDYRNGLNMCSYEGEYCPAYYNGSEGSDIEVHKTAEIKFHEGNTQLDQDRDIYINRAEKISSGQVEYVWAHHMGPGQIVGNESMIFYPTDVAPSPANPAQYGDYYDANFQTAYVTKDNNKWPLKSGTGSDSNADDVYTASITNLYLGSTSKNITYKMRGGDWPSGSSCPGAAGCVGSYTIGVGANITVHPERGNSEFLGWCKWDGQLNGRDGMGTLDCADTPSLDYTVGTNETDDIVLLANWGCLPMYHQSTTSYTDTGTPIESYYLCEACGDGSYWDPTANNGDGACLSCADIPGTSGAYPYSKSPYNWSENQCFKECSNKTCNVAPNGFFSQGFVIADVIVHNENNKKMSAFYGNRNTYWSSSSPNGTMYDVCDSPMVEYCPYGVRYLSCSTGACEDLASKSLQFNENNTELGKINVVGYATYNSGNDTYTISSSSSKLWSHHGPAQSLLLLDQGTPVKDMTRIIYPATYAPVPTNTSYLAGYGTSATDQNANIEYISANNNLPLNSANASTILAETNDYSAYTTDRDLYAIYNEPDEYNIVYDCNGHEGPAPDGNSNVTFGVQTIMVKANDANHCKEEGTPFLGWQVKTNDTIIPNVLYAATNLPQQFNWDLPAPTDNVYYLVAKWDEEPGNQIEYALNYDCNTADGGMGTHPAHSGAIHWNDYIQASTNIVPGTTDTRYCQHYMCEITKWAVSGTETPPTRTLGEYFNWRYNDHSKTFTAQWGDTATCIKRKYGFKYDCGGHGNGTQTEQTYEWGNPYTVANQGNCQYLGHEFLGWKLKVNDNFVNSAYYSPGDPFSWNTSIVPADGWFTFVADWDSNLTKYNFTYRCNGHGNGHTDSNVTYNTNYEVKNWDTAGCELQGYDFLGWKLTIDGVQSEGIEYPANLLPTQFVWSDYTPPQSSDKTYYFDANWSDAPNKYTLSYSCNTDDGGLINGSVPPAQNNIEWGDEVAASDNINSTTSQAYCYHPSKTLQNWKVIDENNDFKGLGDTFTWNYNANKTFQANWIEDPDNPILYTFTYNCGGHGGIAPGPDTGYLFNGSYIVQGQGGCQSEGKQFQGWKVTVNNTQHTYDGGDTFNWNAQGVPANRIYTFVAQWGGTVTYALNYDCNAANGGLGTAPQGETGIQWLQAVTASNNTRSNGDPYCYHRVCELDEWRVGNTDETKTPGQQFQWNYDNNMTFSAKWPANCSSKRKYGFKYECGTDHGTHGGDTGKVYEWGDSYTVLGKGNCQNHGYAFLGWKLKTNSIASQDVVYPATPLPTSFVWNNVSNSDVPADGWFTFVADWNPSLTDYKIIYIPGDGATGTPQEQTVHYGEPFTTLTPELAGFSKPGSIMTGWNGDYPEINHEYQYLKDDNTTLTAQWEPCPAGQHPSNDQLSCVDDEYVYTYSCGEGHSGNIPGGGFVKLYQPITIASTPTVAQCGDSGYEFSHWELQRIEPTNVVIEPNVQQGSQYTWHDDGEHGQEYVFVAKWSPTVTHKYTVRYSACGGDGEDVEQPNIPYLGRFKTYGNVDEGGSVGHFSYLGQILTGWYNPYNPSETYELNTWATYNTIGDTELCAQWEECGDGMHPNAMSTACEQETYHYTYSCGEGHNGTAPVGGDVHYGDDIAIATANSCGDNGWAFDGWQLQKGNSIISTNPSKIQPGFFSWEIDGDDDDNYVFVAQWSNISGNKYDITYYPGNGSGNPVMHNPQVEYSKDFITYTNAQTGFTKPGYIVQSWKNDTETGKYSIPGNLYTYTTVGNTNLEATWYACPAGQQPNELATECEPCPVGWISPTAGDICEPCEPGTVPNAAQTLCVPCPEGTYSGNGVCVPCPDGQTSLPGSTNVNQCFPIIMECEAPNATYATRTWNNTKREYGKCTVIECDGGYHISANVCVLDDGACTVSHGHGTREWNSAANQWGECIVEVCDAGYELSGNACEECYNRRDANGDIAVSTYATGCEIAACMYQGQKYALNGNVCEPICEQRSDESGEMRWDASRQKCVRTCNQGYKMW